MFSYLTLASVAAAQQTSDIPLSPEEAKWFAATEPTAPKAPKQQNLKPAKPAAKATPAAPPVVLEGAPNASTPITADAPPPAAVIKRSGLKGVPHVVQTELPPAKGANAAAPTDALTTGALGEAPAKSAAKPNSPAIAQQAPDAAKTEPSATPTAAPDAAATGGATQAPAADPAAAASAAPKAPTPVTVGIYINDIQDIDFRTNSYIVDLYLWFRWKNKDIDPIKSVEFMNVFDPQGAQKTVLLDAVKEMPDGSLYNIVRYHGRFSKKFMLEKYPFDTQTLDFILEDSVSPASELYFVADERGIGLNPNLTLPGFKFSGAKLDITPYTYPTDFGDLSVPSAETYSRAVVSVPLARPMFTLAIKTFGPILLIVICSTLVFFINPHFVEGRIGLAITALLTLVAIQFTAAASLPDADYFTMLDKLYMLSYGFIIAALLRVVLTSWQTVEGSLQDFSVSKRDHWWGLVLLVLYGVVALLISSWVLAK